MLSRKPQSRILKRCYANLYRILRYLDYDVFTSEYRQQLDRTDFDFIRDQLINLARSDKTTDLFYFEDIRIPHQWGHRWIFAKWREKSGQRIIEFPERDPVRPFRSEHRRLKDTTKETILGEFYQFSDRKRGLLDIWTLSRSPPNSTPRYCR